MHKRVFDLCALSHLAWRSSFYLPAWLGLAEQKEAKNNDPTKTLTMNQYLLALRAYTTIQQSLYFLHSLTLLFFSSHVHMHGVVYFVNPTKKHAQGCSRRSARRSISANTSLRRSSVAAARGSVREQRSCRTAACA